MLTQKTQTLLQKIRSLPGAYCSSRLPAVVFVNDTYSGIIRVYGKDMMELEIIDGTTHENIFWLHVQVLSEEMAGPFIEAFFQVLYQPELIFEKTECLKEKPCRIAIVCSSGLSSQLYASLMEEKCLEQGLSQYKWYSFGLEELDAAFDFGDVVFLAPQIAYLKSSMQKRYHKKVYDISAQEYGLLHASSVFRVLNERNTLPYEDMLDSSQ